MTPPRIFLALVLLVTCWSCQGQATSDPGPLGTPELRAALFDTILARTARREAFSPLKNTALGFDPLQAMAELRDEVMDASSQEELFYALHRLSNARRDRHLSVALIPGGLVLENPAGLEAWDMEDPDEPRSAPVRIRPDYGQDGPAYFIADVARGVEVNDPAPAPGNRILSVNGMSPEEMERWGWDYIRHSSITGFRWKLAEALPLNTAVLPPSFRGETLSLELARGDGTTFTTTLPYLDAEALQWPGWSEPSYQGFALEWSTPTYDLYLPVDGRRVVLLRWHRFSSTLIQDVDRLMAFAEAEGLLDRAVVFDATRSGGGSLGAYAVQRIQPRPFKTTFGNLRLSDVIEPFVADRREAFRRRQVNDGDGPETVDDGTWLMDWLENDVLAALAAGDGYTASVPFKTAHAPKESDGILQPAPVHFRGPLVVLSGPNGGSHLDQFMSIVMDNELGPVMGMPAGGYSNTWEWEEILTYPSTNQPVVGFMWNIGHTIRPNGEILEGNPAGVTHPIPLTAENAGEYHRLLLTEAFRHLASLGYEVEG